MEEPAGIACEVTVDGAGLPHRTPEIVKRDAGMARWMANNLMGASSRGRDPGPAAFTTLDLQRACADEAAARARIGAYLAGRCRAADADADARLVATLERLSATHADAIVRFEAAMSLALRGLRRDEAREALAEAARRDVAHEPWVAGAYLAELGDARGWSGVRRALSPEVTGAYRKAAAQLIPAFRSLDGQATPDGVVDVHGTLATLAEDGDAAIRQVVPMLLLEVEHPKAKALLKKLGKDKDASVKIMAENALRRLKAR